MTKKYLNKVYLEWMYQLVYHDMHYNMMSYQKLFHRLHETDFNYIIGMDGNRAEDGINLRYRFGYEKGYEGTIIAEYLDDRNCSVLEMMIALAFRCEEQIMDDPDIGNQTGRWFWNMIKNLGLMEMRDANFNIVYTNGVISRFLNRDYNRNGEGGLFKVERCDSDLRSVEIWYQMCWYLDEVIF